MTGSQIQYITAEIYHRDKFASKVGLKDTSLISLISAHAGNDLMEPMPPNMAPTKRNESPNIEAVCYLCQFSSVEAFLEQNSEHETTILQCQKALKWYEVQNDISCEELISSTDLRHQNGSQFPQWLVELFHHGKLPSCPLNAAVSSQVIFHVAADNFQKESSVLAGKPIRQCMYALLDITKVVEFIRCGLNIKGVETTREELNGEFRDVTIAMVECLGHQQRQNLFYEILQCDKQTINRKLAETNGYQDWRFVAATLSFWARTTCPPEPLMRALLLCFTLCSLPDKKFNTFDRRLWRVPLDFRQSQEWQDTLHWFSQWQTIYHTAWTLNALLKEPMWVFSPAFFYDGELAMYLASSTDTSLWLCEVDTTLYNCLEEIVLSARLVTPPYDSEDSLSTAGLSLDSPQQAISVGGYLSSTQSTQSPHGKGQPQTQETTSHCEQHGAAATQSTPSPKLEYGMVVQAMSKQNVIEEQQKCSEHEKSAKTPGKAWRPETVAHCGFSPAKPTRKFQAKSTGSVAVVSGNGSPNKPVDKACTVKSSAQTSWKKTTSAAAATFVNANDKALANSTTLEARNCSKQKTPQPAQETRNETTPGNSNISPEEDKSSPTSQSAGLKSSQQI